MCSKLVSHTMRKITASTERRVDPNLPASAHICVGVALLLGSTQIITLYPQKAKFQASLSTLLTFEYCSTRMGTQNIGCVCSILSLSI